MMDTYYFLLVILLLFLVNLVFKLMSSRRYPPGPYGLPVIGYLPWLDASKPYSTLTELSKKYGPIFGVQLGNVYTVVLTDPKVIRRTFARDVFTGRADLYLTHGIMKGYGIIVAEGDRWKEQRRFVLSKLKHSGMVKIGSRRCLMERRIADGIGEAFDAIDGADGVPVDAGKILLHCMGNVLNGLVFGKKWSADDPTWLWLQDLAEKGVEHIGVAGPVNFLPFLRWLPRYRRTLSYLVDGKEQTHRVYKRIVFDPENQEECIAKYFVEKMKEGKEASFTEVQMYHLLADLFGAGVDTTLTTLRWFLLFVALDPQVQDRMQEELDARVGGGVEPSLDDVPFLPYTQACLSEAQRIRPVVPLGIPHANLEDATIEDYFVPKGTMVIPLQWAVHMDKGAWNRPERFDPTRFLDENGRYTRNDHFIPFQPGKRACAGEEMAHMMLFLFGASLVRRYRLTLAQQPSQLDLSGTCGITLVPPHHLLIFTRRQF